MVGDNENIYNRKKENCVERRMDGRIYNNMDRWTLAHAYRFFNFLPIWDSIYNFTGVGSTYTLGRWFLGYAGLITSMFDLPWVNGAFSLFYISIVVILLTEMFEIKNKGMIVLCAAIFVSFPTVVSSFAYMYTADAYLLAFLLATLAVYLTWCVKKWGTIAGMVCLGICKGIYQAMQRWQSCWYCFILSGSLSLRNLTS